MPQPLINLNSDLKALWDNGLEIEVKGGYLLIHKIPYVNGHREVKWGTLVTTLNISGDKVQKPETHVINFIGEHPCNKDGSIISQIQHTSGNKNLGDNIIVNHSFSNKPPGGYPDYFTKVTRYIEIISAPAKSLDSTVTEKTFNVIEPSTTESVFNYLDTNSSRAEINAISQKLEGQKIAIIGLGGTGSYILDLVAKTLVQEIHLFDGDFLLQHNAFRTPGAASVIELKKRLKKVEYLEQKYSLMHRHIITHDIYINESNLELLTEMSFVFICIDKGCIKKLIISHLEKNEIPFIDVGMGVHIVDDKLIGILRVTASTTDKREHIFDKQRISFSDGEDNEYSKNIQIAELNSLNASLAVIKWKKLFGVYQDLEQEYFSTYTINTAQLINDDHLT